MAIPGNDREILSGAAGFSKTCPEVPTEYCVKCGNPESRLGIPLELGILVDDLLGTCDMPELLPVSGS